MNNKNISKKNNTSEKIYRVIFIIALIIVIILSLLLVISKFFGDFDNISLRKNNKNIFSVTDLTVNNIKFGSNEKKIRKVFGKETKKEDKTRGIYNYKILYYNGLKLTLRENYNDYILVEVEITNDKYKTSRNIKINDSIKSVMNKYKVENSKGTYIYGNYSMDSLNSKEITDNIYFALRNKNEIVYINKDSSIDEKSINIAKLNISYKHGKVTKITWSYDFE